jgi:malate dehydrogenase (oxaloacetate-decarboxylating)
MDYNQEALRVHKEHKGKIEVISKLPVTNKDELSVAYTPGVAEPCRAIHANKDDVYTYTTKGNMVAVLSDGSAVLGLGNIGAEAAIPVMEGKAVLFKAFGKVDAFPICVATQDVDEIVRTAQLIAPVFGGINLEDIAAPRCFEVEEKLKKLLDIPVFHDDQHGTAIVVSAAVLNALKIVKKDIKNIKIVMSGAGAAGTAIFKMLRNLGAQNFIMCDSKGIISKNRKDLNSAKQEFLGITNKDNVDGSIHDAIKGADLFVGVSKPGVIDEKDIKNMAKDAIVMAMANPTPEIKPDSARAAGARVGGTGRSDFPNQVNNVLAFPGIFRGALDVRAKQITEDMKVAAAYALAGLVDDKDLNEEYILPKAFDPRVAPAVSKAVGAAWKE